LREWSKQREERVIERIPKSIFAAAVVLGPIVLVCLAYSQPGYFTSQTYLGGLLLFELLAAAVWMYRRFFFPVVIVAFLLAGVDLPGASIWTAARWLILGVGALVGSVIMLKDRRYHFGLFHVLALLAVLAALVSAAVSRYTSLSLLKVLSLLLLFVYAGTGARLAVTGRENRFFSGLLIGCEVFVGAIAACYFVGIEVMGNPNSLGAVMGVVGAPILLWGTLVSEKPFVLRRRLALYAIAMYLTFASHARAGWVAASVSCALLCLALRRYKLLSQGVVFIVILVATAAIIQPEAFSRTVSSLNSEVVYKRKDPNAGLLASRESPWQDAVDAINSHLWFGTGFGTSDNGQDLPESGGNFSTISTVSREHGSSYLAITTWVGMVGVLPFLMILLLLLRKILQTVVWMLGTGNPSHPAVPLAMVMMAGMLHAGLEDWMFAPGYYVCVFYWSMAFVFVDQVSSLPLADSRRASFWRAYPISRMRSRSSGSIDGRPVSL
jgi:O-antigen ligase